MDRSVDYGYAVSRLRAMENRFLDPGTFQRLLDSEDLSSAMRVLSETSYGKWILELTQEDHFDKAIESELGFVYSEVERFVPDQGLYSLCRLQYDIHNVKVILKGIFVQKQGGKRRMDLLTGLGNIPVDDLVMAIESEDYRLLPMGFHRTVPECVMLWDQTRDILQVESVLDDRLFSLQSQIAADMPFEGVRKFVRYRIDAENLRNLARLKRMGYEPAQAEPFFHSGGFVSVSRIVSLINEPIEGWERILAFADVSKAVAGAQDHSDIDSLLVDLERAIDDFLTGVLEKFRYSPFAPENVLSFLWSKEMEAKNVRIALVGIGNGADRMVLRRLLRHV
jgi:V/A-type H+-transporting ATPase subunit C